MHDIDRDLADIRDRILDLIDSTDPEADPCLDLSRLFDAASHIDGARIQIDAAIRSTENC